MPSDIAETPAEAKEIPPHASSANDQESITPPSTEAVVETAWADDVGAYRFALPGTPPSIPDAPLTGLSDAEVSAYRLAQLVNAQPINAQPTNAQQTNAQPANAMRLPSVMRLPGDLPIFRETNGSRFLIRQGGAWFQVRWDRDNDTWRIAQPDKPTAPGIPVRWGHAGWEVHNAVGAPAGGTEDGTEGEANMQPTVLREMDWNAGKKLDRAIPKHITPGRTPYPLSNGMVCVPQGWISQTPTVVLADEILLLTRDITPRVPLDAIFYECFNFMVEQGGTCGLVVLTPQFGDTGSDVGANQAIAEEIKEFVVGLYDNSATFRGLVNRMIDNGSLGTTSLNRWTFRVRLDPYQDDGVAGADRFTVNFQQRTIVIPSLRNQPEQAFFYLAVDGNLVRPTPRRAIVYTLMQMLTGKIPFSTAPCLSNGKLDLKKFKTLGLGERGVNLYLGERVMRERGTPMSQLFSDLRIDKSYVTFSTTPASHSTCELNANIAKAIEEAGGIGASKEYVDLQNQFLDGKHPPSLPLTVKPLTQETQVPTATLMAMVLPPTPMPHLPSDMREPTPPAASTSTEHQSIPMPAPPSSTQQPIPIPAPTSSMQQPIPMPAPPSSMRQPIPMPGPTSSMRQSIPMPASTSTAPSSAPMASASPTTMPILRLMMPTRGNDPVPGTSGSNPTAVQPAPLPIWRVVNKDAARRADVSIPDNTIFGIAYGAGSSRRISMTPTVVSVQHILDRTTDLSVYPACSERLKTYLKINTSHVFTSTVAEIIPSLQSEEGKKIFHQTITWYTQNLVLDLYHGSETFRGMVNHACQPGGLLDGRPWWLNFELPQKQEKNGQWVFITTFRVDTLKKLVTLPVPDLFKDIVGQYYLSTSNRVIPQQAHRLIIEILVQILTGIDPVMTRNAGHRPIDLDNLQADTWFERGAAHYLADRIIGEMRGNRTDGEWQIPPRLCGITLGKNHVTQTEGANSTDMGCPPVSLTPQAWQALEKVGGLHNLETFWNLQNEYLNARYRPQRNSYPSTPFEQAPAPVSAPAPKRPRLEDTVNPDGMPDDSKS